MQLMSFTALETESDLTLKSLKDPATNIRVGTKYLGSLIDKYQGNIPFALSAYNAGPTRVAKWKKELKPNAGMIDYIESIPFHETREYVMSILRNRYWYQFRKGVTNKTVFDVWKDAMPADSPSH
jgi:soluble lytic murein transglycosylase